ncbi:acyltransferase family protein [Herbidospora solisilvae]|uniref:acyltransferase family protein n=1 Tax=Herbidospora solisilvae TaxID=2696284 RepID=UPI001929E358|nr:acyltransferase [Herbidospora solisilvae]
MSAPPPVEGRSGPGTWAGGAEAPVTGQWLGLGADSSVAAPEREAPAGRGGRRGRGAPPPAVPGAVPATGLAPPVRQPRLVELDLLRFVAAFTVMAFHYMAASRSLWDESPVVLFEPVKYVTTLGILGVELFFLISGFVILMSAWGHSLRRFAVSRFARLYPAYWFTVIALYVLYTYTSVEYFKPNLDTVGYVINLTMLQEAFGVIPAGGVFWSLWVELKFYFLISIVVITGVNLRRAMGFMWVWLAAAIFAEWLQNDLVTEIVMPRQAPYFIAGMAFYLIYREGSTVTRWGFVLVGYACSLYVALERIQSRIDLVGIKNFPAPPPAVIAWITVIYVLMAAVALGWLRWVRWRALTTVGALTYPLYLVHQNVSAVFIPGFRESMNPWVLAGGTMLASILLSYAVYRLVDRPGQRLLRRLMGRSPMEQRQASVP